MNITIIEYNNSCVCVTIVQTEVFGEKIIPKIIIFYLHSLEGYFTRWITTILQRNFKVWSLIGKLLQDTRLYNHYVFIWKLKAFVSRFLWAVGLFITHEHNQLLAWYKRDNHYN